jgi:hypothetical protein
MHTSKTPRLTGILAPVLGEFTRHSVTRDPDIRPVSEAVLLRAVIPAGADAVLRVRPLVAADGPPDGGIALSYAAALRVPRGWLRDQLQS